MPAAEWRRPDQLSLGPGTLGSPYHPTRQPAGGPAGLLQLRNPLGELRLQLALVPGRLGDGSERGGVLERRIWTSTA